MTNDNNDDVDDDNEKQVVQNFNLDFVDLLVNISHKLLHAPTNCFLARPVVMPLKSHNNLDNLNSSPIDESGKGA